MVGVARFGSTGFEQLSSSKSGTTSLHDIFTDMMVLVQAHGNVGRVARTNLFEVMFSV